MIVRSFTDLHDYHIKVNYLEQLMTEILGLVKQHPGRIPPETIQQLDCRNLWWQSLPVYDKTAAEAIDATIALALTIKAVGPVLH